jgi:TPR repeat protein
MRLLQSELVIALHELGTSYRFGWGVAKDKKVSLAFFTLAADLGDPDAQSALGFFYQKGWKGACGKDLKISAKVSLFPCFQNKD